MNKKLLFAILCFSILFLMMSCLKNDAAKSDCITNITGVPTAAEIASLQAYLTANNITATKDARGFFYTIVNAGSGPAPLLSSTIIFKFIGKLENGTEFDRNRNANGDPYILGQLISGWQLGIPLIRKGGSIKLYLPPTLAYGCNAQPGISAGSNLIFAIDLVDVQ